MKKENKDIIVDLNFLNDLELVEGVEDPFYSKVDFIQTELKDVFIPNWDNKPPSTPPVLMLNDVPILTYQNTTAIIAHPGFGKSSICESILASIINPDCDSLGFEVSADVVKKAIFIDFERRNEDVWNSWERMIKRAEVKGKKQIDNIYIFGFHTIANFEDRKKKLQRIVEVINPDLILLDGAGDLVKTTNDEVESIELRHWFRKIANDYKCSILTTLHPNPTGDKPRGWIGSELTRESESVLVVKKDADGFHTITTDFAHGKNRNGGKAESRYKYDTTKEMFVSCDPKKGYKESISILDEKTICAILKEVHLEKPGNGSTAMQLKNNLRGAIKKHAPKVRTSTQAINTVVWELQSLGYIYKSENSKNSTVYHRSNQGF
jgi:hypothetical protein